MVLEDALTQLRNALCEHLAQVAQPAADVPTVEPDSVTVVAPEVAAVVAAARTAGIPAERVVIAVKGVWDSVCRMERTAASSTLGELHRALITSVIKAYYLQ